ARSLGTGRARPSGAPGWFRSRRKAQPCRVTWRAFATMSGAALAQRAGANGPSQGSLYPARDQHRQQRQQQRRHQGNADLAPVKPEIEVARKATEAEAAQPRHQAREQDGGQRDDHEPADHRSSAPRRSLRSNAELSKSPPRANAIALNS